MRGGLARLPGRSLVPGVLSPREPGARGPKRMPRTACPVDLATGWSSRSSHKGRQSGSRHGERRSSG
eukprot:5794780-Heterocapsa_arctica.AAC.1